VKSNTSRDESGFTQGGEGGQLVRLAETGRRPITLIVDGKTLRALEGDTVLTALLTSRGHVRRSEFQDGLRAGFCLMGACQDCWVSLADGARLRACSTPATDGMAIRTPDWQAPDV
jgi:predicted molibdopterin-dependent oxidoreductase YjgC